MSHATLARSRSKADWTGLNRQLAEAKALLRSLRETIADIEDARTIERVKKANGNKPRAPWTQMKKEFGLFD